LVFLYNIVVNVFEDGNEIEFLETQIFKDTIFSLFFGNHLLEKAFLWKVSSQLHNDEECISTYPQSNTFFTPLRTPDVISPVDEANCVFLNTSLT